MLRRASLVLALAPLVVAGRCDDACPPETLDEPMSEARARSLDPGLTTGLAASTTYVRGDCRPGRPTEDDEDLCGARADLACARARAPLRVLLVPVGTSVPRSARCEGAFSVEALVPLALLDARASPAGELVARLVAGRYSLFLSADDVCASCGLGEADSGCVLEVPAGGIAVRELVLDVSTR